MRRTKRVLTDEQWERIVPYVPEHPRSPKGGRPPADDRECLEGILWLLRTGARWRDIPVDLPPAVRAGAAAQTGPARACCETSMPSSSRNSTNWESSTSMSCSRMRPSSAQKRGRRCRKNQGRQGHEVGGRGRSERPAAGPGRSLPPMSANRNCCCRRWTTCRSRCRPARR